MKSQNWRVALTLVFALTANVARAQTSYPMVLSLHPLAAQVGTTTEHEVYSRGNLGGAFQIIVTGTGVSAEVVAVPAKPAAAKPTEVATAAKTSDEKDAKKPAATEDKSDKKPEKSEDKKPGDAAKKEGEKKEGDKKENSKSETKKSSVEKLKIRFTIASDAAEGVRDFRVITPQGASTLGQVVVGRDPVVVEKGNNDTQAGAQLIKLPATVCGVIEKPEDVDFFKFKIDAPTALTFHVQSSRCENKIHDLQVHSDPILSIRNSTGAVLALNDNYFFGDPLLHYEFTVPGEYAIEIRDVRYQGNVHWQYSIEINDRPFVTNVHPLRVTPGATTSLELVGFGLPAHTTVPFTLPAETPDGSYLSSFDVAGRRTSTAEMFVSRLPELAETDKPNDTPEAAQEISFPSGLSGRIATPADLDYYAFEAKKGELYSFEIVARRAGSALDAQLRIVDTTGKRLLENDDAGATPKQGTFDAQIENWKAPADGRFFVEVSDLNLQGGPEFVYFLEATRAAPYFVLEADMDKTLLWPGGSAALFVKVVRKNGFIGPVQLGVEALPAGVKASCGKILEAITDGCIIFTAADDAPLCGANLKITGHATVKGEDGEPHELTATAVPLQETYMPGGGRGHYPVSIFTLSVGAPLDIQRVTLSTNEITLKPGGSEKIDVTIERASGYDKNVTLDILYRHLNSTFGSSLPIGVTIDEKNSKLLLTGKESKGYITLTAPLNSKPAEAQLVPVMAHVSLNFVMKVSYSSPPLLVTVLEGEKTAEPEKKPAKSKKK